jgi:hypothetical protein
MELMAAEAKNETSENVGEDSDMGSDAEEAESEGSTSEDSSDSEYEEVDEGDDEWEDASEVPKAVKGAKKKKAKAPKVFTPVDKVCCVGIVMFPQFNSSCRFIVSPFIFYARRSGGKRRGGLFVAKSIKSTATLCLFVV